MEKHYGMSGWQQFLQNRRNILCEVDRLLELTTERPLQTAHGEAGEAKVREWLSEFLPKKYGVTSGYIIPNNYNDEGTQYHFDVIVYDVLESPILWVEGNVDHSNQGRSMAIPAEHVRAVYEVKARITLKSAREAITKLKQLNVFKGQLGDNFNSAIIFIDLVEKDVKRQSILSALCESSEVHGFWGGTILRCSLDDTATALIDFFNVSDNSSTENNKTPLMKPIDEVKMVMLESGDLQMRGAGVAVLTSNGVDTWHVTKQYMKMHYNSNLGVSLAWSRGGFADFSIKILGKLAGRNPNGDENEKEYVFGRVFDYIEKEEAKKQAKSKNMPFLVVGLEKIDNTDNYFVIKKGEKSDQFTLKFAVTNSGDVDAKVSTDKFKTTVVIPPSKTGVASENINIGPSNESVEGYNELIEKYNNNVTPLEFTKRFVYRTIKEKTKFYCVTVKFKVFTNEYTMEIL